RPISKIRCNDGRVLERFHRRCTTPVYYRFSNERSMVMSLASVIDQAEIQTTGQCSNLEILIYKNPDNRTGVKAQLGENTLWLTDTL
ncbi:MAG TPA: hypothetical protein PKA44_09805, partial [Saprospiraceae bacterium]|nr:hypothetical protein [Saprospiraceae bacterium]